MKRTIVIGTRNTHKLREITEILAGLPVVLRSLRDYPNAPEVEETGETFEENARKKAEELADALGEWVMADDSGLEVEALHGRPGVLSARYAGPDQSEGEPLAPQGAPGAPLRNDARNIARLLSEMKDVPEPRRAARFRCVIALAAPGSPLFTAHGECAGRLLFEPRGTSGFGYDPIFLYPPLGQTFAELAPSAKNEVSHRAQALKAFREKLEALLAGDEGRGT